MRDFISENVKKLVAFSAMFLAMVVVLGSIVTVDYRIVGLVYLIQDMRILWEDFEEWLLRSRFPV